MANKFFFALLGLLCIAFIFYIIATKLGVGSPSGVTYDGFESFWVNAIHEHSPKVAYEMFKESYASVPPTEQHLVAHLFGGALYEAVGIEGLPVCDMYFASGCFHEFLGRALLEHGEAILHEIDTYCKSTSFDCQHGVGHGLLAYSGYEYADLLEALNLCNSISTTDTYDGCFGGIFMEYNVRTMLGVSASTRSQKPDEKPDALCLAVPQYAQNACYFWLAQWLLASQEDPFEVKVVPALQQCQQIENTENRLTCYSGMANEMPSYTDNRELMARVCDEPSLATQDQLFTVQCRSGVASSLFMDLRTREYAVDLCRPLSGDEYEYCTFFATQGDGKRIIPYTTWSREAE